MDGNGREASPRLPALTKHQRSVVDEAPPMYKGVMERAVTGRASPRSAIKAFCLRCVGYLREDVTNCTAYKCPLHTYRPYQDGLEVAESGTLAAQDEPETVG